MYSRLPEGVWQQPVRSPPSMAVSNTSAKTFFMPHIVNGIASGASVTHIWQGAASVTMKSLKAQLILDQGNLQGSFFHRTVILICQHDAEGAFGLVLNRAAPNKVGDALVANLPDGIKEQPLYLGGPVQPQALSYLHKGAFVPDANVLPNLSMGHSLDTLLDLADSFSPDQQIKIFAGYAGWSPGQLDDEMKRDTWMTHPGSLELVFDPHPEKLWQSILRQKGFKYKLIAEGPEDPSWN